MKKFVIPPKLRNSIELGMKFAGFAFLVVWDLFFLWFAGALWVNMWAESSTSVIGGIFLVWYLITMVWIASWVATKAFKRIAVWEYPTEEENPE